MLSTWTLVSSWQKYQLSISAKRFVAPSKTTTVLQVLHKDERNFNTTGLHLRSLWSVSSICKYSYLLNTTPWVIIRTGVGFPSLGFYYCPWFSLFPTLGYYPALGFLFFPPLATIQPLVLTSSHPWLLFSPWFSTFTHPWLGFLVFLALFITYPTLGFSLFSTLGYYSALGFLLFPPWAINQPLVFHFYPPLAKILSFYSGPRC